MKQLPCNELGGPCEVMISGATFEELGANSKAHVMEEVEKGDEAHIAAVQRMREATPDEREALVTAFRIRFKEAPEA